jgi:OOP family OmpA-OmpF porin
MSSVELANRPAIRHGRPRASRAGLILIGVAGGCASGFGLSQRMDRVSTAIVAAETRGAMRCAPRELAIARSHLEFARLEEEQGFPSRARQHLDVAEENVQAASALSPPGRCTNEAP